MNKIERNLKLALALLAIALATQTQLRADTPPPASSGIEFLSGESARSAIIDDSADPYFSRLEEHEMTAKTSSPITGATHADKLAECKKRYQEAVLDFTDDDKAMLAFFVEKLQVPLKDKYPLFGYTPWSFIKVKDTLEGGMPHTRGSHVVLPAGVVSHFSLFKQRMGDRSLPVGGNLLIHEQTHVLERLHPDLFEPFFTDGLHFIHAKKIESNAWLTQRQLLNPDGTVCDWIFPMTEDGKQTYVLPLISFIKPNPVNLKRGMEMIGVTMKKTADGFTPVLGNDGNPTIRTLEEIPEYMAGPGAEQDNYHPNEIMADRFAELVVLDDLADPETKRKISNEKLEERLKPTRDWAKNAFTKR